MPAGKAARTTSTAGQRGLGGAVPLASKTANTAALRGGAKRTALGDVSNRQPLAPVSNAGGSKPAGLSARPLRPRDVDTAAALAPSVVLQAPAQFGIQYNHHQHVLAPAAEFRDDSRHHASLQVRETFASIDLSAVQEVDLDIDLDAEDELIGDDEAEDDDRTEISDDYADDDDEDEDLDQQEHYNEVAARPRSARGAHATHHDDDMEIGDGTCWYRTADPMPSTGGVGGARLNARAGGERGEGGRWHQQVVPEGAVTEPVYGKADRDQLQRVEEEFVDEWNEWEDISMVQEYADDIFAYMHRLERKLCPSPDYMAHQTELEWKMRGILVDWLVQVHARFHLLPETLFLTVNFIDRFLTAKAVSLQKLQLVGATALFLASKYEEIQCPSVSEIVFMVDNGYSADEILKAERFMVGMLDFELGWPGPMSFLRRISKADDYDVDTRTVAKYLLECMLMSHKFVACPPSFSAAVADYLARVILDKGAQSASSQGIWTEAHVFFSTYTERQVRQAADVVLRDCLADARTHHAAVFEKYAQAKQKKVSTFVENWFRCKVQRGD